MKYFALVVVGAVGVQAFTIQEAKTVVDNTDFQPLADEFTATVDDVVTELHEQPGNFMDSLVDTPVFHQIDDWWQNWEPTTAADTTAWVKKHVKPIEKRSYHAKAASYDVHQRVAERRAAAGRPPLMTVAQIHNFGNPDTYAASENLWLQYDGIDNFANILYSFITGFIYTPGETSICSESILTYFSAWVNSIDTIKKIYLPYNWPNTQVVLQDIVASGSEVIEMCDVNKLFTTVAHMFSVEGLAELGARVAGAAPFELIDAINAFGDETMTSGAKARKVGKLVASILNYHI